MKDLFRVKLVDRKCIMREYSGITLKDVARLLPNAHPQTHVDVSEMKRQIMANPSANPAYTPDALRRHQRAISGHRRLTRNTIEAARLLIRKSNPEAVRCSGGK